MKKCCLVLLLIVGIAAGAQTPSASHALPQPRLAVMTLDPSAVTVLHLKPGYVSSVRLPEEVSSVVLGDPDGFKAEHSPAEPLLVFLKPATLKPAQTNVLITTKSGHQVSLHLVSDGRESSNVDFVLEYERPHSFFVSESPSTFLIGATRNLTEDAAISSAPKAHVNSHAQALLNQTKIASPQWQGEKLQVAVGHIAQNGDEMIVGYSVLNASDQSIDLLAPQLELTGSSKHKHGGSTKAELVAIKDYQMTLRHLGPGARADGIVLFERPPFKQSAEGLLLRIAQADAVDNPVLISIAFTAPVEGETK
ncbi:MAG TPA: hypothetical protein VFK06_17605 [Candidatus Angelobacter sp.]|nr:hypothetical protein [Candidatus Angelobacter sp.]